MNYIQDLIERINSDEELPQSGLCKSSQDTVSWQAYREAEKINDITCLVEMKEIAKSSKRWSDVVDLAFICSWLIKNTGENDARRFYLSLKRKRASSTTMMYLIDGATEAGLEEYAEPVREMMKIEFKKAGLHFSSGIEYLGRVLKEKAVKEIGEALDNDCWNKCDPFYCCIQLGNIGSLEATPYLTRAVERHKPGKKGSKRDVYVYALNALNELGLTSEGK